MPFREIVIPPASKANRRTVEPVLAYVATVEPQHCRRIIQQFSSTHSDGDWDHLKRVRTVAQDDAHLHEAPRTTTTLRQVLLGSFRPPNYPSDTMTLEQVPVSPRPPESPEEWAIMNTWWPTKKTHYLKIQNEQKLLALSEAERQQMEVRIQPVIAHHDNNYHHQQQNMDTTPNHSDCSDLAWMIHPVADQVMGNSHDEERLQQEQQQLDRTTSNPPGSCSSPSSLPKMKNNPLQTPVLYAIQSVSRRERQQYEDHRRDHGVTATAAMRRPPPQQYQYLCTGLDLYTYHEPTLYEGMAALHSRVRRILFVVPNADGGAFTKHFLHALPHTNHHFRVFQYCCDNDDKKGQPVKP